MKTPRPIGLYVAARRCSECLIGPNPVVSPERRKEVLADCKRTDRFFVCHKEPLDGGPAVCCRGFFETFTCNSIRIAERLRMVVPIEVEKEQQP